MNTRRGSPAAACRRATARDGTSPDDGLYILLKEVIDNSIDEHIMGNGKEIRVTIDEEGRVEVRDFGRGIPLGKLYDCAAQINTGAKYDSEAFKKTVGLNGVGIKAVNALSGFFEIQAWRDGETKAIEFSKGQVTVDMKNPRRDAQPNGTRPCRMRMIPAMVVPAAMAQLVCNAPPQAT